jgi:RNA polymerase sigma factor (sigma-70 family)
VWPCCCNDPRRYAYRATGRLETAEDAVQESFLLLYRALRQGREIESPRAWTLAVVRRQLTKSSTLPHNNADLLETLGVLETMPAGRYFESSTESEWTDATELFSVLTRREEEALLLRLEPLKYRQIAQHMGVTIGSVEKLLARALSKLQQAAKNKGLTKQTTRLNAERHVPKTLQ